MEPTLENLRAIGVSNRALRLHMEGFLSEILDLTDLETALAFAMKYGGKQIFIPVGSYANSQLIADLGAAAVDSLADRYAGEKKVVPAGPFSINRFTRLRAVAMFEQGASLNEVAQALRLGRVTVRSIAEKYVPDRVVSIRSRPRTREDAN